MSVCVASRFLASTALWHRLGVCGAYVGVFIQIPFTRDHECLNVLGGNRNEISSCLFYIIHHMMMMWGRGMFRYRGSKNVRCGFLHGQGFGVQGALRCLRFVTNYVAKMCNNVDTLPYS